jgi:lipopolysaccharide transport system permease protein
MIWRNSPTYGQGYDQQPVAVQARERFESRSGVVTVGETVLPYAVYVFTGTMLWAIFMDALNAPLHQTRAAKTMLAKPNFPREAPIVSGIYQMLFNAAIKLALLFAALLWFGILPDWGLLLFPLGVLSIVTVSSSNASAPSRPKWRRACSRPHPTNWKAGRCGY